MDFSSQSPVWLDWAPFAFGDQDGEYFHLEHKERPLQGGGIGAGPEDLGMKTVPHKYLKRGNPQEEGDRWMRSFCGWESS